MPNQDPPRPAGAWEANFIEQMARLRESRKISQTELAKRLRAAGLPFHQQTIQRVESGERPVRLNEAFVIARELGSNVELMSSEDEYGVRNIRYVTDDFRRTANAIAEVLRECLETLRDEGSEIVALFTVRADKLDKGLISTAWPDGAPDPLTNWMAAWVIAYLDIQKALTEAFREAVSTAGKVTGIRDVDETWGSLLPQGIDADEVGQWLDKQNIDRDHLSTIPTDELYGELNADAWESYMPEGDRERLQEADKLWEQAMDDAGKAYGRLVAFKAAMAKEPETENTRNTFIELTKRYLDLDEKLRAAKDARWSAIRRSSDSSKVAE
jgi:transcriptional regulator with XRE-family HTH domain